MRKSAETKLMKQIGIRFAPSFLKDFDSIGHFIADYSRPATGKPLKQIASDMDMGSSQLRSKLMGHDRNVFSAEDLRSYILNSGDLTPIYFLLAEAVGDFKADDLRKSVDEFIDRYEAQA